MIVIFGYGVVGNAVHTLFYNRKVLREDPALGLEIPNSKLKDLKKTDLVVIAVPAEATDTGYDLSEIYKILKRLETLECKAQIAIKTTILPRDITELINDYKSLDIFAWPEFLNNATAEMDIVFNPVLIGCKLTQLKYLKKYFKNPYVTTPEKAFAIKMCWNLFGALKVSFWHSIQESGLFDIKDLKPTWDNFTFDFKQGDLNTIAKDGLKGYGGKCFPKDTEAYLAVFKNPLIQASHKFNSKIRKCK